MAVSGAAVSYTMLLSSRVFLGVVTATAGPTAASLVGDMFRPAERGRILGWIDVGDLIGVGAGFLLVGAVIALLSWRWVFFLLAVAGAALVVPLWRRPEPRRRSADGHRNDDIRHDELAELIRRADIEPDTHVDVPHGREASLVEVVRYVLQVKTNAIVILASAIGYFFLAGLRIFAVVFAIEQYRISHAAASFLIPVVGVGAVAGMIAGGHVGDFLLHRGHLTARLLVGAAGFLITAAVTVPAVLTHSVAVALPLLTVGAFGLAAPNPPMDAVRLDIVHPAVWGRAEGVRTMLRTGAEALAPLLFGFLADHLAGGGHRGLQVTIIVMLPALVANAVLLLVARRFYLRDIATVHSTLDPGRR
jgi:MFS family permease